MLLACYGGTFDPVHRGHVAIARAVGEALDSRVWLLPSADPPHRPAPGATAEQRARMLELAVANDPCLGVDPRELDRQGPSYTVDTLRELRREHGPRTAIVWVLGMDSVRQLDGWNRWRELLDHANLLGVERPGAPVGRAALADAAPAVAAELDARRCELAELAAQPSGAYAELPVRPLRTESATHIRQLIASGGPWERLVPEAVAAFIRQQGLYGTGGATGV